jgi:hypothetical protein
MALQAVRAHARAGRNSTPQNTLVSGPPRPPSAPSTSPVPSTPSVPPAPLSNASNYDNRYTIAQRVQCLTLRAEGFSGRAIKERTGIESTRQNCQGISVGRAPWV